MDHGNAGFVKPGDHEPPRLRPAGIAALCLWVALTGCSASGAFRQGVEADRAGDAEQAIRGYTRAVRKDPGLANGYFNRAIDYAGAGQYTRAVQDCEAVVRLDPEDAQAHNNLGVALAALGENRPALESLSHAVRLDPGYADACYNLGNIRAALGDPESAVRAYSRAVEIDPGFAEAYHNRAAVRARLGDLARAEQDLTRAVDLFQRVFPLHDDKLARASYHRGLVYRAMGKPALAGLDFSRACRLGHAAGCEGKPGPGAGDRGAEP